MCERLIDVGILELKSGRLDLSTAYRGTLENFDAHFTEDDFQNERGNLKRDEQAAVNFPGKCER